MGIFDKPKNKRIAKIISIKSPTAFNRSVKMLKRGGLDRTERKALDLARNRANLQTYRKALSSKERRQMRTISQTKY